MITDTKEIAERLRTEADYWRDYNEDDTIFNMSNYHFTESVLITFGIDDMDIYTQICLFTSCSISWRISSIRNRVKAF
jgi:hypothetical protein